MGEDAVANLMTRNVITLPPHARVAEAADRMIKSEIGSIVVAEGKAPLGIVTERDLLKALFRAKMLDLPLSEVMSKPVVTVGAETPAWEGFRLMLKNRIRRLPVVKDRELIGIVTERDLFRWVVKVCYGPNVPEDVRQIVERGY